MPFSVEEFFALFEIYNLAIWPAQLFAAVAGLITVALLFRPSRNADRAILTILAAMWLLNGVGYHLLFFSNLNPAAPTFGIIFAVQAFLILAALRAQPMIFDMRGSANRVLVWALVLYALLLYPAVGFAFGHRWPQIPVFGVAPCPTTIFTIGVLLTGRWPVVRWLLPIPVLWSGIGGSAAVLLAVPQDLGLIGAGLVGLGYLIRNITKRRSSTRA